jgi:predicted O-methyltransferase YrrM
MPGVERGFASRKRAEALAAGAAFAVAELPPLVQRAETLARELGFEKSSVPEVGRLLAVLTAARPGAAIAEAGTGAGVGAAWIAGSLADGATLVTVERDERLVANARVLFADLASVRVEHGDVVDVLSREAPFDLVFLDGASKDPRTWAAVPDLLRRGGLVVKDDLTPGRPVEGDPLREFFFGDPRLLATEILVAPWMSVLVAARV